MADAILTSHEQEKLAILQNSLSGNITNEIAAKQLGISVRQVQRAKSAIRRNGVSAVVHGLKGKTGNHHIDVSVKEHAITTIEKYYLDFKPTFAKEKLKEKHEITISAETTRLWMMEKGLWKSKKQKKAVYHAWRERKPYYGELEQFDGSYHYWLEDRYGECLVREDGSEENIPIEMCLLASIDDATGRITKAAFAAHEGIAPVFTFWKEYCENELLGKPVGIYLDKFSTYKINHRQAVDNSELMTQFQRAMQSLGITVIHANSPQAKGRVERLFQTLQDRLVKELRLAQICTPEEANIFLQDIFIQQFNERFSVTPAKEGDVHTSLTHAEKKNSNHIFSIHFTRRVNHDFTIQFHNHWYQLEEIQPVTIHPKQTILVEEWLDGSIHFMCQGKELHVFHLPQRPERQKQNPLILTTHRLNYKQPDTHPWKRAAQAAAELKEARRG